jgi:hypothetical protein
MISVLQRSPEEFIFSMASSITKEKQAAKKKGL